MALPYELLVRQQRFATEHPQWSIHAQDDGSRFTAEKTGPHSCHVVAALTLGGLLDRLEEIEDGGSQ